MGPEAARWLAGQDPDDPAVQVVRRALEGDEDARDEVVAAVRRMTDNYPPRCHGCHGRMQPMATNGAGSFIAMVCGTCDGDTLEAMWGPLAHPTPDRRPYVPPTPETPAERVQSSATEETP